MSTTKVLYIDNMAEKARSSTIIGRILYIFIIKYFKAIFHIFHKNDEKFLSRFINSFFFVIILLTKKGLEKVEQEEAILKGFRVTGTNKF